MLDDEFGATHVPGTERRVLGREPVSVRQELRVRLGTPRSGLDAGPVLQHRARAARGEVDDVASGGRRQFPAHLFDPTSSPETKCFWNAKNTIVVGMAAIRAPAATTFQAVV